MTPPKFQTAFKQNLQSDSRPKTVRSFSLISFLQQVRKLHPISAIPVQTADFPADSQAENTEYGESMSAMPVYFRRAICSTAACAQYSPNGAVTSILAP